MLEPWGSNVAGYSRLLLARLFPRDYSRELARTARCPPLLGIETINVCNADCVFCAYQYMERPKIIMDFDLYRKIIRDCAARGGRNVGLASTVGDPVLDPRLLDRIACGRSPAMQGFVFSPPASCSTSSNLRDRRPPAWAPSTFPWPASTARPTTAPIAWTSTIASSRTFSSSPT